MLLAEGAGAQANLDGIGAVGLEDAHGPRRANTVAVQEDHDCERIMKCIRCLDTYWVCEAHEDRPWDGDKACGCGAPGMPCPDCNKPDPGSLPRLPGGFQRDLDEC